MGEEPDYKSLVRTRGGYRGMVTRYGDRVSDLCKGIRVGESMEEDLALRSMFEEFTKYVKKLDEIQDTIDHILAPEDMEADQDNVSQFFDKSIFSVQVMYRCYVKKYEDTDSKPDDRASNISASVDSKLPKLRLPHFSGDVREWEGFWEQFVAAVDDREIPQVTKFLHLRSVLKGEARAVIAGLALTAGNYKTACDLLRDRFGRKDKVILTHIQDLLSLTLQADPTVVQLWEFYNTIQTHVRSLEALGVAGQQCDLFLTPIVLACLPQTMRLEWARGGEGHEADVAHLLGFLKDEAVRRERSMVYESATPTATASALTTSTGRHRATASRQGAATERRQGAAAEKRRGATAATTKQGHKTGAKQTSNPRPPPLCLVCGHDERHYYANCPVLIPLSPKQRQNKLTEKGVCYKCLKRDGHPHDLHNCTSKCVVCTGSHNKIVCTNANQNNSDASVVACSSSDSLPISSLASPSSPVTDTLLQTIQITVKGKKGATKVNALLDTGADRTYVSQNVVNKIQPEWLETSRLSYASFGSEKASKPVDRHVYSLLLQGDKGTAKVDATCIPYICAPTRQPSVPSHLLSDLPNVVSIPPGGTIAIDLLIGLDFYWKIMTGKFKELAPGLVAQKSVLGWVVSGSVPSKGDTKSVPSLQLFCKGTACAPEQYFWDLEAIGITDQQDLEGVDHVMESFKASVKKEEDRYTVSLPWKEGGREKIVSNKFSAMTRLQSLKNRFAKDPELGQRYHEVISTMWKEGMIEEVDEDQPCDLEYYLPHHPVVKENSLTTKVRPVFDASAKSINGVSLNDCVEAGPNLLPDLIGVLLRFRRWQIALTADVQKAFLQVGVDKNDRDAHRFLWDDEGTTRVMRFTRIPFGNKASPFLLMATIRHHLGEVPSTTVSQELGQNLYMDDWLSGCDQDKDAFDMFSEAQEIMEKAGMKLAKWASNCKDLSEQFKGETALSVSHKVLGLEWSMLTDMFSFEGLQVADDTCITKRTVLSLIARLFDPMGFLNPFIIRAKILFQKIWQLGLSWDQLLPEELQEQFRQWLLEFSVIKRWSIPRCFFPGILWSKGPILSVHGFGDASEHAYGACIYLVAEKEDGTTESTLVISRARVAPLKSITLPRLELLGALLCARLITYVKRELMLQHDIQTTCWTDSTVTLAWIKSDPKRWKTFVSNRVSEIQSLIAPENWHHCPGKSNPADLVTRGLSATELSQSDLWLHGPSLVMEKTEPTLSTQFPITLISMHNIECEVGIDVDHENPVMSKPVVDTARHCSLLKAMRVMAIVQRFTHNCRFPSNKRTGEFTFTELTEAKLQLLRDAQKVYTEELKALREDKQIQKSSPLFKLSPFIGKDGLLRIKGRLQFANLPAESQHPIILPKCPVAVLIARHMHQQMKHAGVQSLITELRNSYWIIGARKICKAVKKDCVSCQRFDSLAPTQPMAPLPEERVTQSPPFAVTGLDHAGPLYCGDYPGRKFYILLFTCAVVRAVHLELVDSLSCDTTILALRRFFARRGVSTILWSDNAKGFVAASTKVLEVLGPDGPEWRFIAPRGPWWGGWWERLIGSVKSSLRKSLGKQCLCRQELETVLQEVECCINSRPLTFVGDDLDSCRPLTPAHFLLGRASHREKSDSPFNPEKEIDPKQLAKLFEVQSNLLQKFWTVWQDEYIKNLPPFTGKSADRGIGVGSVVLVEDEGQKISWPLGIVEKMYPGRDQIIRRVDIRTQKGTITRPIQRLRNLEITTPDNTPLPSLQTEHVSESVESESETQVEQEEPQTETTTRSGRMVKKRAILDL